METGETCSRSQHSNWQSWDLDWCSPAPKHPVLITRKQTSSFLALSTLPPHVAKCSCLSPVCPTMDILEIVLFQTPFCLKCLPQIPFLVLNPNLTPVIWIHWSWLYSAQIYKASWVSYKLISVWLSIKKKISQITRRLEWLVPCSSGIQML